MNKGRWSVWRKRGLHMIKLRSHMFCVLFPPYTRSRHVLQHNWMFKNSCFGFLLIAPFNPKPLRSPLCAIQPISTSHGSRQSTRGSLWRTTTPSCSTPLSLPWIKMPHFTMLVTATSTMEGYKIKWLK